MKCYQYENVEIKNLLNNKNKAKNVKKLQTNYDNIMFSTQTWINTYIHICISVAKIDDVKRA